MGFKTQLHALEQIRSLELPLHHPHFAHYPSMKLGERTAIGYFGERLTAMVRNVLRDRDPEARHSWLVTSPPFFHLPSAANLLAESVHQSLLSLGIRRVDLLELRMKAATRQHAGEQSVRRTYDYSRSSPGERAIERQAVLNRIETEGLASRLAGRRLLLVNDINVTGTQQASLEEVLLLLGVRECEWFYIFDVERSLAHAHPELEHRINTFPGQDREKWLSILDRPETRPTARCISRLLLTDIGDLAGILKELKPSAITRLRALALSEGRFDTPEFAEKLELFALYSSSPICRQTGAA